MSQTDDRRNPLFDPAGMWRLLTDVQRLGLEAAANVAERFSSMADRDLGPDNASGGKSDGADSKAGSTLGADAEKMVDAYFDLMQVSWDAFGSFMKASVAAWAGTAAAPGIRLSSAEAGKKARGDLHLHNSSKKALDSGKLRVSDLVGSSGAIPSAAVSFDPKKVSIDGGSSGVVKVKVAVPDDAKPGLYLGVISAPLDPPVEVAVSLRVLDSDS